MTTSKENTKWVMGIISAIIIMSAGGYVSLLTSRIVDINTNLAALKTQVEVLKNDVGHYHSKQENYDAKRFRVQQRQRPEDGQ